MFDNKPTIGQIISTPVTHNEYEGDRQGMVAASIYEYWGLHEGMNELPAKWVSTGKAYVRIEEYGDKWAIRANILHERGLVCFLPPEFDGKGIISLRITQIGRNSVTAMPTEWVESPTKPITSIFNGCTTKIMREIYHYDDLVTRTAP